MTDEKLLTIREVAARLHCSYQKARLMVIHEPGVQGFLKNSRTMWRIPESVVERIIRRSTTPAFV